MSRKIYVIGNDYQYANWMGGKLTNTMEEADLVVMTGGEDVTPTVYGEKIGRYIGCNPERDAEEILEFEKAMQLGIPIIGICRSSQMLSALNGGKVVQHQPNSYSHLMKT